MVAERKPHLVTPPGVTPPTDDAGAEALIERLLERVRTFSGDVAQEDDQTVVVLQAKDDPPISANG